jgi:hypothetical protein
MNQLKKKYLIIQVLAISVLFIFQYNESFSSEKYIFGKVVYSDDLSPVINCKIRVARISELNNSEIILEETTANSNGVFRISIPPLTADGIKIMAYPNEQLDNIQNPFEKKIIDFEVAMENQVNKDGITIKVQRVKNNQSQKELNSEIKNENILSQNFPNPFNPTTLIRFDLPNSSKVSLKIYNMNGANVATLVDNKNLKKGINEFEFNAEGLPSGIYIYRLNADEFTENRKMILVK